MGTGPKEIIREKILTHLDQHPGIVSPENKGFYSEVMRDALFPHIFHANLGKGEKAGGRQFQLDEFNWQAKLRLLRKQLCGAGQATGYDLGDFALVTNPTRAGVRKTEVDLDALQNKIGASIGQEVIVTDRHSVYNLARIKEGLLHIRLVSAPDAIISIDIATQGYATLDTRGNKRFSLGNLLISYPLGENVIGNEEIQAWQSAKKPRGAHYQELSRVLALGLEYGRDFSERASIPGEDSSRPRYRPHNPNNLHWYT